MALVVRPARALLAVVLFAATLAVVVPGLVSAAQAAPPTKTCPPPSTLNAATGKCETPPSSSVCPTGTTLSAGACTATPTCPPGLLLSGPDCLGGPPTPAACPAGTTIGGAPAFMCSGPPKFGCPAGFSASGAICTTAPTLVCPPGQNLVAGNCAPPPPPPPLRHCNELTKEELAAALRAGGCISRVVTTTQTDIEIPLTPDTGGPKCFTSQIGAASIPGCGDPAALEALRTTRPNLRGHLRSAPVTTIEDFSPLGGFPPDPIPPLLPPVAASPSMGSGLNVFDSTLSGARGRLAASPSMGNGLSTLDSTISAVDGLLAASPGLTGGLSI